MSKGPEYITREQLADWQKALNKAKRQGTVKKIKQKTDYSKLCAHPTWKAETHFGITTYKLPMPPSANRYWRTIVVKGRAIVLVSEDAKNYKEAVSQLASRLGMPLLKGHVSIVLQVCRAQKSGDLDNRIKVTLDALKGIAFEDDEQVVHIDARRFESPKDPYIVISVNAIDPSATISPEA